MAAQGVKHFVELGPKDVLCGLIKRTVEGAETTSDWLSFRFHIYDFEFYI